MLSSGHKLPVHVPAMSNFQWRNENNADNKRQTKPFPEADGAEGQSGFNYQASLVVDSWILQYSLQHNVIGVISKHRQAENVDYTTLVQSTVPHIELSLYILRYWRQSLETGSPCVDVLIDTLHDVYCHTDCLPIHLYMGMDVRFKLLVIMKAFKNNEDEIAKEYLSRFFPSWSSDLEHNRKQEFKIRQKYDLQQYRKVTCMCHSYLSRVMSGDLQRQSYFDKCYEEDKNLFLDYLGECIDVFFRMMTSRKPQSVIDQILSGQVLCQSSKFQEVLQDAKVKTFLEGLKKCVKSGLSFEEYLISSYLV